MTLKVLKNGMQIRYIPQGHIYSNSRGTGERLHLFAGCSGVGWSECIDCYQMDAVRRIPVCRSRKGSEGSQAAVPELVE